MNNPTHNIKKFIETSVSKPRFAQSEIYGWLGSGIKDCKGKEICEGDILEVDVKPQWPFPDFVHGVVTFMNGAFYLRSKLLSDFAPSQLRIVDHIVNVKENQP